MTKRGKEWPGPAVDRAAADNRATRPQRAVSAVLAAAIIAANFGPTFPTLWIAALAAAELFDPELTGSPEQGNRQRRWQVLLQLLLATLVWSSLPLLLLLLFRDDIAFRTVAIIICCMQMMHAQSFGYRSRAAVAVMIVPPALLLGAFALASNIPARQLTILVPALLLAIFYVIAGTRANAAAAEALDASHREIERLAYTDPTTGIANRRRFAEELGQRIDTARGDDGGFTLALVDLDGLKAINDAHGHDIGDAVLAGLAARLAADAGAGDLVARLGGDEFAWLMPRGTPGASLRYRLEVAGRHLDVTASVGAAHFPGDGDTAEALFKAADVALYAAKRAAGVA